MAWAQGGLVFVSAVLFLTLFVLSLASGMHTIHFVNHVY